MTARSQFGEEMRQFRFDYGCGELLEAGIELAFRAMPFVEFSLPLFVAALVPVENSVEFRILVNRGKLSRRTTDSQLFPRCYGCADDARVGRLSGQR